MCRRLCQELAKTGPLESQILYRQQLQELEPLVRFCQYEQSRAGGSSAASQEQLPEQLQVRPKSPLPCLPHGPGNACPPCCCCVTEAFCSEPPAS